MATISQPEIRKYRKKSSPSDPTTVNLSDHEVRISNNEESIASNADAISSNADAISSNETAIEDHETRVAIMETGNWKLTPESSYTATPASTSTITMSEDLTAVILVGMTLRYTIGGTQYYGLVTAITSVLLSLKGPPLSAAVTELRYDGGTVQEIIIPVNGAYEEISSTSLLKSFSFSPIIWLKRRAYIVSYAVWSQVADTSGNGKVSVRVNDTEINTATGGLIIAAGDTWYSTVVDIRGDAYDINIGESLELTCVAGTSLDAENLCVILMAITP